MRKGFTLIELAITLTIIGVLIGGLLIARSMTDTAKIQRLITDLAQYGAAANQFKEVYEQLPGDSPQLIPPGNGDNWLGDGAAGSPNPPCALAPNATLSNYEYFQFFYHLTQAEMLDKSFTAYSPTNCGGPHPIWTGSTIVGPWAPDVDPGPIYKKWQGVSKVPLSPGSFGNSIILGTFFFYLKPSYVLPLETKIGAVYTSAARKPGTIYNPYGAGTCPLWAGGNGPCLDETATAGYINYDF